MCSCLTYAQRRQLCLPPDQTRAHWRTALATHWHAEIGVSLDQTQTCILTACERRHPTTLSFPQPSLSSLNGLLVTMETNKRSVWVRELKKEREENPLLFKGISPFSNEFCLKAWGRASGAVRKLQALKISTKWSPRAYRWLIKDKPVLTLFNKIKVNAFMVLTAKFLVKASLWVIRVGLRNVTMATSFILSC